MKHENLHIMNMIRTSSYFSTFIHRFGHPWHTTLNPCCKKQASGQSCDLVDNVVAGKGAAQGNIANIVEKKNRKTKSCLLQCFARNPILFEPLTCGAQCKFKYGLYQSSLSFSPHYFLSSFYCTYRAIVRRPKIR